MCRSEGGERSITYSVEFATDEIPKNCLTELVFSKQTNKQPPKTTTTTTKQQKKTTTHHFAEQVGLQEIKTK